MKKKKILRKRVVRPLLLQELLCKISRGKREELKSWNDCSRHPSLISADKYYNETGSLNTRGNEDSLYFLLVNLHFTSFPIFTREYSTLYTIFIRFPVTTPTLYSYQFVARIYWIYFLLLSYFSFL